MRRILFVLLLLCPSPLLAQETLKDGRVAQQKGNYPYAEEIFTSLAAKPQTAVAASLGLSRALESQGKYDAALAALDPALKADAKNADVLARRAELLYGRGRWDEATKDAKLALQKAPDHLLARWILAQITRDSGDWAKADEEFRWFVKQYEKLSDAGMEPKNPDDIMIIGLAGLERARYHHLVDQYTDILRDFFEDTAKNDKLFWQAEYTIGRVYAEKHNKAAASKAFDRALKINPRAAEVFAARADAAFSQFEMKDADQLAEQALKINPNLPEALRAKAAIHLFSGENDEAMKLIDKARKVNPRDESTLAQYAAVLHAQRKFKEFDAVAVEVEKFNPKAWRFNFELGSHLDSRKLFNDSGKYYRKAIDLEPKMPEGHEGLGMLEMRLGNEPAARKALVDAFDADPFNVRVSNTLKVLDHLERYETIKSPHYIVRFDPKNDAALARFTVHYLEKFHKDLEKKFDFHPKEAYLIEIFNKHEMFSGRVAALPDLHTIGACTGRMFAMVSTHDKSKQISKPFNWNRVLRHEVVHLFNLDQTKFQIPHWFTEGLAVTLEGKTTPPQWNYILADKLRKDDLLNLDNILLGFVRPRTPDQWQQAYLQSELYVQYLVKTQGEPAISKLLSAFAEGLDTDAALPKAIGVSKADFEKGYRKFIEDRVKNLNMPPEPVNKSLKELKEERKKTPDDPDVVARLADKHFQNSDSKIALELANEALQLKNNHPLAAYVKARILMADGKNDLALAVISAAVAQNPDEPKSLKLLAKAQIDAKDFGDAAKSLEAGRKLEPYEGWWLVGLAAVYQELKQEDKLMDVLKSVVESDPDVLSPRIKLAEYYAKEKNWPESERYALSALEIDVKNVKAREALLEALEQQNKNEERAMYLKLLDGE